MCHFITLIVPTDDTAAVQAVLEAHGRKADPIENPSIRKVLNDVEHQYLTTIGHCDCGTVLTPHDENSESPETKIKKAKASMKRKGWSNSKIARAVTDMSKADARSSNSSSDSIELWYGVLHDLAEKLKLPHASIFIRLYSGSIATEAFKASRLKVSKNVEWKDALASLKNNEVTVFPFN